MDVFTWNARYYYSECIENDTNLADEYVNFKTIFEQNKIECSRGCQVCTDPDTA
jgi:hypothetical protein